MFYIVQVLLINDFGTQLCNFVLRIGQCGQTEMRIGVYTVAGSVDW